MHNYDIKAGGVTRNLSYFSVIVRKIDLGDLKRKDTSVNVPYRNGLLYTDLGGGVVYQKRTLKLDLLFYGNTQKTDYSDFANFLNATSVNLYDGDVAGWHYEGRPQLGTLKTNKNKYIATLTLDAYPYMYKDSVTTVTLATGQTSWSGTLINASMPCLPTITLTTSTAVSGTINGTSFSVSGIGAHKLTIPLKAGSNVYSVSCSDTAQSITITYQEGKL